MGVHTGMLPRCKPILADVSERIGAPISAALDGNPPAQVVPLRSA